MWVLGPIGFATPWVLAALAALPVVWLLLRALPPAPRRQRFPGVALLLGLADREQEARRTPWWLLALRLSALAAVILAAAGPVLNPRPGPAAPADLPLVVLIDNGWAAAPDWPARMAEARRALAEAARKGRPAAVVTTDAPKLVLRPASAWQSRLAGLAPVPWLPDPGTDWLAGLEAAETLWISDGLARPGRAALAGALGRLGPVSVREPPAPRLGLLPGRLEGGALLLEALRSRTEGALSQAAELRGPGPAGAERVLARATLVWAPGEARAQASVTLPPELRNRVRLQALAGVRSAGAVALAGDSQRRPRVGLFGPGPGREGLELLAPDHYLRRALETGAEVIEGTPAELVRAGADVIALADVALLGEADATLLAGWVREGGLLLRFAGPRLAAADEGRGLSDPLLPVRLRAGGRVVGGAMSWGQPRRLAPFAEGSPFHGLAIPGDVSVRAQVLAEPGPELARHVIAALEDGTPLVTQKAMGAGQVVLFHVTANAEWSSLPLSGLFVAMLERLAVAAPAQAPGAEELAGTLWTPVQLLDGFGAMVEPRDARAVEGPALLGAAAPDLRPGLYAAGTRRLAVNALGAGDELVPARWPGQMQPGWGEAAAERPLAGWLWLAALGLLALDALATLGLSGRLGGGALGRGAALVLVALVLGGAEGARAQDLPAEGAVAAAARVTLAYVITGDAKVDAISRAGLAGLSQLLFQRTSIEPGVPVGVDPGRDDLAVYPLIYWPVTPGQALPDAAAIERLNAYLHYGGMIVFDTRDADRAALGGGETRERLRLRLIAAPLDIPPLEPVPADHVLTRSFYLLSDFPGRHAGAPVWVEAAPAGAERAEGVPFRQLNDGVTPVVIGGNDWAGAWAVDEAGRPLLPVGRGQAGERQREMARRFGVNLVMHVLTGNYKSDQVHVPTLLERLGQ